jgi:two-component system, LytTR family, response regulator
MAARAASRGRGTIEDEAGNSPVRVLLVAEKARLLAAVRDLFERGVSVTVALGWVQPDGTRPYSPAAPARRGAPYARRLAVRSARGVILYLPVEQIDWIEASNQYVRLHVGGKRHLLRASMLQLESWLDPARFQRIHRSAIINLERVREIQVESRSERWVVLADGTRLQVSQPHWAPLHDALVGLA